MPLIVKGTNGFIPAPEGLHAAVCVDVVDLGQKETPWGSKHKLRVIWEIDATMADGRRYVVGKTYTASLHEKSALHKDLRAWRGQPFVPDELAGFDLERILGASCQLLISHAEREGVVYANVAAVMKAGATRLNASGSYVRAEHGGQLDPVLTHR